MNTIEQTKYKQIYKDYEELGTLQLVGDKHELTRERVRQILAKGTSKGLFKYKAHNIHQMLRDKYSKEDFMEIIKNKTNVLTYSQQCKLAKAYKVDVLEYKMMQRKAEAIRKYVEVCRKHKKWLSSYPVQRWKSLTTLRGRVSRYWDTFGDFQKEVKEIIGIDKWE